MPKIPAMRQLHHEYILESLHTIKGFSKNTDSISLAWFLPAEQKITAIRMLIEKIQDWMTMTSIVG